ERCIPLDQLVSISLVRRLIVHRLVYRRTLLLRWLLLGGRAAGLHRLRPRRSVGMLLLLSLLLLRSLARDRTLGSICPLTLALPAGGLHVINVLAVPAVATDSRDVDDDVRVEHVERWRRVGGGLLLGYPQGSMPHG